jgi:hypothetical protein
MHRSIAKPPKALPEQRFPHLPLASSVFEPFDTKLASKAFETCPMHRFGQHLAA